MIRRWVLKITLTIIVTIVIRMFFFDVFYIPSSSMEKTLKKGDYIFVSKLHYGPRLPRSIIEIPIINSLASIFISDKKIRQLINSEKPYKRIHLFSKIKKNDVFVFNTPIYQSGFSVKRCKKMPLDTLLYSPNSKIRFSKYSFIHSDSLGNIIVPKKKMLNLSNNVIIKKEDGLKEKKVNNYLFKYNYYYAIGDNIKHSTDSRSWGLIQEDHIVGKALFVLFSNDKDNGFLWSRFLKPIN